MDRDLILWIAIGILFVAALFLVFNAGAGSVVSSASGSASSSASAASYGGMVGGC